MATISTFGENQDGRHFLFDIFLEYGGENKFPGVSRPGKHEFGLKNDLR